MSRFLRPRSGQSDDSDSDSTSNDVEDMLLVTDGTSPPKQVPRPATVELATYMVQLSFPKLAVSGLSFSAMLKAPGDMVECDFIDVPKELWKFLVFQMTLLRVSAPLKADLRRSLTGTCCGQANATVPQRATKRLKAVMSREITIFVRALTGKTVTICNVWTAETVGYLGQHRQMMFTGMEKWHLKGTIDALPMILQLALLSFWLGLITLLWSLSRTVACVALAFAITGAVFYFYTAIAAVFDSSCPFQTPAIPLFRRALTAIFVLLVSLVPVGLGLTALTIVLSLFSAFILVVALPFFLIAWLVSFFPGQTASYKDVLGHILDTSRKGAPVTGTIFSTRTWIPPSLKSGKVPHDVDGNSARWVLESSMDDDLLLRTAMNITALRDLRPIFRLCYPTVSFLRLIVQFTTHVGRIQQDVASETDAGMEYKGLLSYNNLNAAVHYARALIHVSLAAPSIQPDITFARSNTILIDYIGALQSFELPQSSAFNELRLFRYIAMDGMRYQQLPDIQGIEGLALPIYIAALMGPPYMFLNVPELAQEGIEEMMMYGSMEEMERESRNETKRQHNRLRVIAELALATLRTESSTRPSVLNLLSWAFATLLGPITAVSPNYGRVWQHRWEAYTNDASLFSNLGNALTAYTRAMAPRAVSSDHPYDVAKDISRPDELMEQIFQVYVEILKSLCAILSKRENGRKYEAQLRDTWPSLEGDINNMRDWLGSRPESQQKTTMSELIGSFAEAVRNLVSIQRILSPAIETGQAGDGDTAGEMPTLGAEQEDGAHMMDGDRKESVPLDAEKF